MLFATTRRFRHFLTKLFALDANCLSLAFRLSSLMCFPNRVVCKVNTKWKFKLLYQVCALQQCIYNCFVWADKSVTNRILAIKAKKRCCCYSAGQMCALSAHNKKMILELLDLFQKLLTSFSSIFIGLKIKWHRQHSC